MGNQQRNRDYGTFNDCNSSTFEMVIGQSNLHRNMKPHDVGISHIQNALAYKLSMMASGQKSKNVFAMVSNAVSWVKPPTLNLIQNNLERMRIESQPVQVGPYAYQTLKKGTTYENS